ncbi:MAG: tetratricopeptide repeat protein [Nitrospiraceae bacterium]|nr:tetratricopeptide repeat protein [Nitrospiraceae bacterium]
MRKLLVLSLMIPASLLFACQKSGTSGQQGQAGQYGYAGSQVDADSQLRVLKVVVSQDPKNLRAWIDLGNAAMDSGRYKDAIDAYHAALKLDPKDLDVRVDMGTCYRNIGQSLKAVEEYKKVLAVNPNHAIALRNMGVVLAYDLHQKKEAVKMFKAYIKQSPSAPDAGAVRQEIAKIEGPAVASRK